MFLQSFSTCPQFQHFLLTSFPLPVWAPLPPCLLYSFLFLYLEGTIFPFLYSYLSVGQRVLSSSFAFPVGAFASSTFHSFSLPYATYIHWCKASVTQASTNLSRTTCSVGTTFGTLTRRANASVQEGTQAPGQSPLEHTVPGRGVVSCLQEDLVSRQI